MTRHETDYFSLAAGLLFTMVGLALGVSASTGWQIDGRWLLPVMLIVLGAGGVAASLAATRREQAPAVLGGEAGATETVGGPTAGE